MGELRLSTGTTSLALARRYDALVVDFKELGRLDILEALRTHTISFAQLYANKTPAKLEELLATSGSPTIKPLVTEWLERGAADLGLRDRSMDRYASSWKQLWAVVPETAKLKDLTQELVSDFKRHRANQAEELGKSLSPATLNRDLAALGAFLSWCAEEKGLLVTRPVMKYQRESKGRIRWLTIAELSAFKQRCPDQWWPLFALLFGTGMSISEALGLRRTDVNLITRRVSLHEEYGRKLKRDSRARELSLPESLVPILEAWFARSSVEQDDRVFPFTYWPARKAWAATCKAAEIFGATIHDARHTFAVHAVQNGVPEARLQKLLGHSHAGTTRRYAMHSPEQFLQQDAERVSRSMGFDLGAV
jgi:integrase